MSATGSLVTRRPGCEEPPPVGERPQRTYSRDDFEFGSLLGIGALAQVVYVRDNYSENEYALKILDKKQLRRFGKVSQVITEKDMLLRLDHPGIVKLYFTFQDSTWLYLALELCPNGDLSELISRKGRLPTSLVQHYTAELVSILWYLRKMGVAHRDIKPENLLISESGNLKLADFDTAKVVAPSPSPPSDSPVSITNRTNTFVGTAQYVSPEMLHDSAVAGFGSDLWALGCVVFQMLTGYPPFRSSSEYLTFQRILATDYEFPADISEGGKSFVACLLALDPQDRLGFSSVDDLKQHPFLREITKKHAPDGVSLFASEPPLEGVMRLRGKRRHHDDDSGRGILNSSDEDDMINQSSQLVDEDEFMALFSVPSPPTLVRSVTTAPENPSEAGTREVKDSSAWIAAPPASPSLQRCVSSPAVFVSSSVDTARSSAFMPRTMSTAANFGGSKTAWEKSINLVSSSVKPAEFGSSLILPRTETETSPIPTDLSSPMVHSDIAPLANYLQRIVASDERILMSGMVLKRRFFGRNRILVVTDLPRLLVLEPKYFRTVCEIALLTVRKLVCDSSTEFSIATDAETWHGEVRDGTAPAWVALMQSLRQKAAKTASLRPPQKRSILKDGFGCSDLVGSNSLFARGMSSDLPSNEELHAQAEARAEAALRKLASNEPPDPKAVLAALREEPCRDRPRANERTHSSSCVLM